MDLNKMVQLFSNKTKFIRYIITAAIESKLVYFALFSEKVENVDIPKNRIQKFKWSPTGHYFSYVYGFDVFINTVRCYHIVPFETKFLI